MIFGMMNNAIGKKIKRIIKRFLFYFKTYAALAGLSFYGRKVLSAKVGNILIKKLLAENRPLMITRLGNVELQTIAFYVFKRSKGLPYPEDIRKTLSFNAGFFPISDENIDKFAQIFIDAMKNIDALGVWFNKKEDYFCRKVAAKAELFELPGLDSYFFAKPWTAALAGKKVLVINPLAKSITKQYGEARKYLFKDKEVLPEFELKTVKAVLSHAGAESETGFSSWFEALDFMKGEIAKTDFDIALIGAGAYGLPLAAYVKSLGKQAVHVGGSLQLLFGIRGKRWDDFTSMKKLYNEYWVRPLPEETPAQAKGVEGGCYW